MVSEVMGSLRCSCEFLERVLVQIRHHRMPNSYTAYVTAGIYAKKTLADESSDGLGVCLEP